MRYLVAGGTGMLGTDLVQALEGREVLALGSANLDITDRAAATRAVAGFDVVINAAAYTRVDDAESDEETAFAVNALGAGNLAAAAAAHGAVMLQISTDYVFSGDATAPYPENTRLRPIGAYGRTKAEGERLVMAENAAASYIVRTAWLYGAHGGNFARTMLSLAASHPTVSVVDDQFGQPTWTRDVAAQVVALLDTRAPFGAYHATSSGAASWFDFARAVYEEAGLDPERVQPTTSAAFPRPAPRPAFSVLGHAAWSAAGLQPIREWRSALADAAAHGVLETPA